MTARTVASSLLLLHLILAAPAFPVSPGTEARCNELINDGNSSTTCFCSEPLDVDDNVPGQDLWDPSDSPNSTECIGAVIGSTCDDARTNPGLDYGGTNPPTYVVRNGVCSALIEGEINALAPNITQERVCARWYMRVDNNFVGSGQKNLGCPREDNKLFDMCNGHPECSQLTDNTGTGCSTAGSYHEFVLNVDSLTPGDNTFMDTNFDWNVCRKDGSGNGGWCRFELCAGGDLNGSGNKVYTFRLTSLDLQKTQTISSPPSSGPALDRFFWNWYIEGSAPAGMEISYWMEAGWATDSGQFIGPASEIEGSGGGTPAPPPGGTVPAPPTLLP